MGTNYAAFIWGGYQDDRSRRENGYTTTDDEGKEVVVAGTGSAE